MGTAVNETDVAAFGHIRKGAFHRWLGKKQGAPITAADIQKGLKAGGHPAKMASFARSAQHKFKPRKKTLHERAGAALYGAK